MGDHDREPDLHCFPTGDDAFRADVQAALARSRASARSSRELLEAVRRDLRERYPAAEIREQDPWASVGRVSPRWYVYRDGRVA